MSKQRKAKLIAYSNFKNIWRFVSFFITVFMMALFYLTGFSTKLRDLASKIKNKFFSLWLYLALFLAAYFVATLPFSIYREFLVEVDYGFMNQSFGQWFIDEIKGLVILITIGIVPAFFFYHLVKKMRRWWLAFSLGSIPFLVFFVIIAPVFISPLFNDFLPLENQQLKTGILNLADRAGIENSDVFQVNASKQSSKINAYVTGMFGTKRIVLYDTMIDNFEEDEIFFVMGHEMGHYVQNHLWWSLLLSSILTCAMLWLIDKIIPRVIDRFGSRSGVRSLSDHASLPLLLLFVTVISFVFQPFQNGFSRYAEHQSDIYGMEITDVSGESAAIAFDKLGVYNLSDPSPHPLIEFWFYSHPALSKRMEFVRNYQR